MRLKVIIFLTPMFYSCTPSPCPELSMKKPNYYVEEYLTYNGSDIFTGRCASYKSGELRSIRQYLDGYDHGKWTFYYTNGRIETKGRFNVGKRIGEWKYYYDNGKLKQISNYNEGKREGLWFKLSIDGDTIWTEKYLDDKLIKN